MSRLAANTNSISHPQSSAGVLPDDLHDYLRTEPWPHAGRSQKNADCDWTVADNWPECIPVTEAEVDVFEAWFGDIFDQLLGACQ
jgi:hypothetical protein